jgi:hypothetical protein
MTRDFMMSEDADNVPPEPWKVQNPLRQLPYDILMAIDRHYVWAGMLNSAFLHAGTPDSTNLMGYIITDQGAFFVMWCGMLYAVLDAIRGRKIDLHFLASFDEQLFAKLKPFRNKAFHVADRYFQKELLELLRMTNVVRRVEDLHIELHFALTDARDNHGGNFDLPPESSEWLTEIRFTGPGFHLSSGDRDGKTKAKRGQKKKSTKRKNTGKRKGKG